MEQDEELLLTDEDWHSIDRQLAMEAWATLALASRDITLDEYELHRDEHLCQIVKLFEAKAKQHYEQKIAELIRQEQVNLDATVTNYEQKIEELFKEIEGKFDSETTHCTVVRMNKVVECYVIPVKDWQALKGK